MYNEACVAGGVAAACGMGAVSVLPNTGNEDLLLQLAISVATGLIAWGIFYAYAKSREQKIGR